MKLIYLVSSQAYWFVCIHQVVLQAHPIYLPKKMGCQTLICLHVDISQTQNKFTIDALLVHKNGDFLYKMGGIASLPNLLAKLMSYQSLIFLYVCYICLYFLRNSRNCKCFLKFYSWQQDFLSNTNWPFWLNV